VSSGSPSSEARPQWVFAPKPKRRTGRVVLIVALIALVVAIALTSVILLMPRADSPGGGATTATPTPPPTASASATRTPSSSVTPRPTATPTATAVPDPTPTDELPPVDPEEPLPVPTDAVTAPPVVVPDTGAFATAISPRVADADTGLGMLASQTPDAAFDIVRTLEQDAMILADENPPDSIASSWRPTVQTYLGALGTLRTAIGDGTDTAAPLAEVRTALQAVKDLAGL
jgi:cytoskeletal protein RodZ